MSRDLKITPTENKPFYFLSYNSEDQDRVAEYAKALHNCGIPLWYDEGIEVGSIWETSIAKHIKDCEAVLMFISCGIFAKEQSFVYKEYEMAKRRNKKPIIVLLDDIKDDDVPDQFFSWWIDVTHLQCIQAFDADTCVLCAEKIAKVLGIQATQTSPKNAEKAEEAKRQAEEEAKRQAEQEAKRQAEQEAKRRAEVKPLTLSDDEWKIENGVLMRYRGNGGDVVIPKGVTSIGDYAFLGCKKLTSIYIPEGVTSIGDSAFRGCEKLTSVNIPEGVTSIGDYAFSWCKSLTSVNIPESVTSIGDSAFSSCKSLTSVNIPKGVTSIGDSAFSWCKSLTSINIPEAVTSIGDSAFWNCSSLTSINLPESVTSIGDSAFSFCFKLTTIYCEANSKADGWDNDWLGTCNAKVLWGYKK